MKLRYRKGFIIPFELRINVTTECNRTCIGCSKEKNKEREGPSLELKEYIHLIDELTRLSTSEARLKSISITGGEPLFPSQRSKTYLITEHAKSYGLKVRLCTNGDYLDNIVSQELKMLEIDEVQIGLDSSGPEFQNWRSQSQKSWENTINGVDTAVATGLNVSVRYTLYTLNLADVASTYRLVSGKGVSKFKLRILFPSGAAIDNCLNLIPTGDQLALAQYWAIKQNRGSKTKLELSQPCFYKIPEGYHFLIEDNRSCGEENNASIDCKGIVEYCLFCDDGIRFGNVRNQPFPELWNSSEMREIRQERKRDGIIVGCPAFEVQYNRYIGNYINQFEIPLIERTRELEKLL